MGDEQDEKNAPLAATREALRPEHLPGRLCQYAIKKNRALSMADYIQGLQDRKKYIKTLVRLRQCCSFLHFRHYYTINEVRLHNASFCMLPMICPLCAQRRGLKATEVYDAKIKELLAQFPGSTLVFITLTIKNRESLIDAYDHVHGAYQDQIKKRYNAKKGLREKIELNKALAGVVSYEIKRGEGSGLWHPHLHGVLVVAPGEEINEDQLREDWFQQTGDSWQVRVKPFDNSDYSGFFEVFTYQLKFSTMTVEDNWQAFQDLRGHRMINSFGELRKVKIPEDLLDDKPSEDLPYWDQYYAFLRGIGYQYMTIEKKER